MLIKVAGAVLNQVPLDWAGNRRRISTALKDARLAGASIVCLPELCITGYGCEDAFFAPHVQDEALKVLESLLPETRGLVVTFGLPMSHRGVLFNVTAVVCDGRVVGLAPKKHLAGDGVHYEPRWFKAWPVDETSEAEIFEEEVPFGDLHFDFSGLNVGLEICEEAWVAERPGARLAKRGVDVILNPSASHFAFGKLAVRKSFVCEGSRAFNVAYVYSNLLGNEAGRIIFDGGVLIADAGQVVAQGERFSFRDVVVTSAVVDVGRNRVVRARTASYRPELSEPGSSCAEVDFEVPAIQAVARVAEAQAWEASETLRNEEFSRAVALGLFDFLRKSRQNGFVVSLSGGVDSSAVVALCRMSLDLAAAELGLDGLKAKLSYIAAVQSASTVAEIARHLIRCAYQATDNSSEATRAAADAVAAEASATYHEWSVETLTRQYRAVAEAAIGESLSWNKHDATLQNIQARARGPSIWMLANIHSALLLATSNRSEAAVGYATMDGDTCGGISPIGGIDKNFLRAWALWLKEKGPVGLSPWRSFEKVLSKPPTAELRPAEQNQTDEDDLMPYDVLDAVERMAIRDKLSPQQCLDQLRVRYPTYEPSRCREWIVKFFRLWCRNQWKRERYAPAFHLDDESLDPKTWCRFPILSSGYEEELRELHL